MIQSLRPTRARRPLTVGALCALLVLSGCSSDSGSSDNRASLPTTIPAPAGVNSAGAPVILDVVNGGDPTGLVITDYRGFAVYGVSGETVDSLICIDDCITAWIPLTAGDRTATADRLDATRLGSVVRPDGITQVTYADVPLYLWTGDDRLGITGGAGVAGTWFALTETGGFIE